MPSIRNLLLVGVDGIAELKRFAEQGGHLVLVDGAIELAPTALGFGVQLVTGCAEAGRESRRRRRGVRRRTGDHVRISAALSGQSYGTFNNFFSGVRERPAQPSVQ